MDYKPLLTRDYKSIAQPIEPQRRFRITGLHMLLISASVAVIGTFLAVVSYDAKAVRPASLDEAPVNARQVSLPLSLELPAPEAPAPLPALAPATLPAASGDSVPSDSAESKPAPVSPVAAAAKLQWEEVTVKSGDSLARIFNRLDLAPRILHDIMQSGGEAKKLARIQPGQQLRFGKNANNELRALVLQIDRLNELRVERDGETYQTRMTRHKVDTRVTYASGKIDSSLFEAGRSAGLSNTLIMELAGIFGWDIDFVYDIREGDSFNLIYEEHFLKGERVNEGPIVAAEFINQGKTYRAVRFTKANGDSDYYAPDGRSMRKAFLRTPVDFSRISSRFGKRHHPVLNRMRMHKGVDYAAPTGTPIKASGDGKIIFKGRKGGYGRCIIIKHGGRYSTLYAHMNGYRSGMYVGKRVKQGQVIGYVGASGRATGPHLHYEFRVHGVHRNPLTVKLPDADPINKKFAEQFETHAQGLLAQLEMHKDTQVALSQP